MAGLTLHFILACLPYLCILRATEGTSNTSNIIEIKIVGGSTTTVDQLKYIVYLRKSNRFICGGCLISTIHVITAGHCVTRVNNAVIQPSLYTIHGGTTYLKDAGVVRQAKRIAIPGNFKYGSKLINDIAVVTLASPMTGPNIATIPLCASAIPVGVSARVSGWGVTKTAGRVPNQLHTVILNTISNQKCKNYYGNGDITSTMFCATTNGKGGCHGDSGGPLVFNDQLYGIVSFGEDCVKAKYPTVFTSIYQMRAFILRQMKE